MHTSRRERADLVLGQGQRDLVGLHAGDRAGGDDDLPPPPEMAVLEHEVGDLLLAVEHEPVHMAEASPSADVTLLARRISTSPIGIRS